VTAVGFCFVGQVKSVLGFYLLFPLIQGCFSCLFPNVLKVLISIFQAKWGRIFALCGTISRRSSFNNRNAASGKRLFTMTMERCVFLRQPQKKILSHFPLPYGRAFVFQRLMVECRYEKKLITSKQQLPKRPQQT
jgi:hypothetical protein